MHHHAAELNDKSRDHLFYLFKPNQGEEIFKFDVRESSFSDSIDVYVGTPAIKLFELARQGFFRRRAQVQQIKAYAKEVITKSEPIISQYLVQAHNMNNPAFFTHVAKIAGNAEYQRVYKMITKLLRDEYNRMNFEEVKRINSITDEKERRKALNDFKEKMERLMTKVSNLVQNK